MPEKTRILVVDDELPVCKSIAASLESEQHAIDMVQSGEEALRKAGTTPYHIVITDLMMPGIGGMDLLKALKKAAPETMVIMVTGFPSVKTAVDAIKHGAFDYLPKPFTPKDLRAVVTRAKSRQGLGREAEKLKAGLMTKVTYCIPENSWARVEEDGTVRAGVHHMFLKTIPKITDIEFPKAGDSLTQGEAFLRITDGDGRVNKVWTPVSGQVAAVNEAAAKDMSIVQKDPYAAGWVLLMTPANLVEDLKSLLPLE